MTTSPPLQLVIGNRNFSSWSLRAWLVLEQSGAEFETVQVWLDEDVERVQRRAHGPTGRVPVLKHGELVVWDTLAITEYAAELCPDAGLWPAERAARARARSLCSEMHSGFEAVRTHMPMNLRARKPYRDRGPDVAREVERLVAIWTETRAEFGANGPFLFGRRSAADAFFAPVASRFRTYGIQLQGPAANYAEALFALPAMAAWTELAEAEGHALEPYASVP